MNELRVQDLTKDELLREIERLISTQAETETEEESVPLSEKTWLSLEEASEWIDATPATLRKWRKNGLRESEVEGRIYVKREDLDAYIQSHL